MRCKSSESLARREGLEPPAPRFEAWWSMSDHRTTQFDEAQIQEIQLELLAGLGRR